MPGGNLGGSNDMLTASPWGTQESGVGWLRVDARASRSNKGKAPSATATKAGTKGRHQERQGQGGHNGGRWEFEGAEPSGVWGNNGGHEAFGVEPDPR